MAVLSNTMLQGTAAVSDDTDYQIAKSLKFNDASASTLKRTVEKGDTYRWTYSTWLKRSANLNQCPILSSGGSPYQEFYFTGSTDRIAHYLDGGGENSINIATNNVFRDPAAWQHLVLVWDSTETTELDRVQFYVNGERQRSLASTTYADLNQQSSFNRAGRVNAVFNGLTTSSDYFSGYAADTHFVSGLVLGPEAFATRDVAGNWNPKEFKIPTPNTDAGSPDWSAMCSGTMANSSYNFDYIFDGNTIKTDGSHHDAAQPQNSTTATFTKSGDAISANNSIEINIWRSGTSGTFKINDVDCLAHLVANTSNQYTGGEWYTLIDPNSGKNLTTLSKIEWSDGGGYSQRLGAIRVDGVILRDSYADPDSRINPNNGTVWSTGNTFSSNPTNAFNGNLSDYAQLNNSDGTRVVTTQSFTVQKSLRVKIGSNTGYTWTWTINGTGYAIATSKAANWYNIPVPAGTTVTTFTAAFGASSGDYLYGVEVDGHLLIDSSVDNSFHLKYSDTTENRNLGYSQVLNTPTGAQPMYGPGANDSTKSSLVLAIPGYDLNDHTSHIKGSGINKTITLSNGDPSVSSTQSKFYGSSLHLDGDDAITCGTSSDFSMGTGDFTVEGWFWFNSIGSSQCLMEWDNNASATGSPTSRADGGQWYFSSSGGGTLSWFQNNTTFAAAAGKIVAQTWTHLAVVVTGGNMKMYKNGTEISSSSYSLSLGTSDGNLRIGLQGSTYFTGYINDFRVYKAAAKYTSTFVTPVRNDFTVANLIKDVTTTTTDDLFKALTWSGTGSNRDLTGVGFQPDFAWIKNTNDAAGHRIFDSVRGSQKSLKIQAEEEDTTSEYGYVSAYNADGVTLTNGSNGSHPAGDTNHSGRDYVGWFFKAGGTAVSNTNGDITSTVTASSSGAFSIVSWTSDGASSLRSVGHGLSKAPDLIIVKNRADTSNSDNWQVYFSTFSNKVRDYMYLHNNDAKATSGADIWGTTASTFSFRQSSLFDNGEAGIAYCFANVDGVLKVGSYAGSNSTVDVETGFRPRFLITKCHDVSGQEWIIKDSARGSDKILIAESSAAQSTARPCTFNETGFSLDANNGPTNYNGRNYYYLAIGAIENITPNVVNDSPTNYEEENGVVHGNFATLNYIDYGSNANPTHANTRLSASSDSPKTGTIAMRSGKWYWEVEILAAGSQRIGVFDIGAKYPNNFGANAYSWCFLNGGSRTMHNNSTSSYGSLTFNLGTTIGLAYDADAGKLWVAEDNVWQSSGDPAGGSNPSLSSVTGHSIVPAIAVGNMAMNFGAAGFKYTPPSGFKALCSNNLPDLFSGDDLNNPSKYFNAGAWYGSGDGTTKTYNSLDFQPDLLWFFRRNGSTISSPMYDVIRGTSAATRSNDGNGESAFGDATVTPTSTGFTITGSNTGGVNGSTDEMTGWFWDAGTAANGSVDSCTQTVNAQWTNPTAGFSITSWEGASSVKTVAHGLGTKPDFFMTKRYDGNQDWIGYHQKTTAENMIGWNDASGKSDSSTAFNDTEPTNTLITYSTESRTGNTDSHITYAWTAIEGYSDFGQYIANGQDPNGTFCYTGFQPRWLLIFCHSNGGTWGVWDTARHKFNMNRGRVVINTGDSEIVGDVVGLDILSNGFKIRSDDTDLGGSEREYLYAAFAEQPLKTARAF